MFFKGGDTIRYRYRDFGAWIDLDRLVEFMGMASRREMGCSGLARGETVPIVLRFCVC